MSSEAKFTYPLKTGLDLALARRRLRVTQPELAKAVGYTVTTLSLIENGHVNPTPELLSKIRAYFERRMTEAS